MTKGDIIMLAAGGASVASATAPIMPAHYALHWYCMAGAVMGAIAMAAVPSKEEPSWKQLAWRIIGCAAFGVSVAPWVIRQAGWSVDAETVLGASASVGAAAWLGGRIVSSMSTRELIDAALYFGTLGRFGKLPGDRNEHD